MITRDYVCGLPYIKKEELTGSYQGMRFKLFKKEISEEETKLGVVVWPEPFSFPKTSDEEKTYQDFEFSEDGIDSAIEWMNHFYEESGDRFPEAAQWSKRMF